MINPLSANPTKWWNTLKQFFGETIRRQKPANCLSVFDQFVILALKGLMKCTMEKLLQICRPTTCNFNIKWTPSHAVFANSEIWLTHFFPKHLSPLAFVYFNKILWKSFCDGDLTDQWRQFQRWVKKPLSYQKKNLKTYCHKELHL